jgi:uncharacterized protein
MKVTEYPSASEFLEATRAVLMENEPANALMLSYAERQIQGVQSAMSTKFYLVEDEDGPLLPAMFTPDIVPLLSDGPEEAARLLARFFYPKNPQPKGVNGPKDTTLAFADEWEHLTRCNLEIQTNSRIYICKSVEEVKLPLGSHRTATQDDFDLVKSWRQEFKDEVDGIVLIDDEIIRSQIEDGKIHLWINDQPVSQALFGGETGNGGMIGVVYTPPEHRNQGYATAITAALTQTILDNGKKYAILYTDLDNPTSNSIYQQIGYSPLMDSTLWRFKPAI